MHHMVKTPVIWSWSVQDRELVVTATCGDICLSTKLLEDGRDPNATLIGLRESIAQTIECKKKGLL